MEENVAIPLMQFQRWMQHMLLDPHHKTEVNPLDFLPSASNNNLVETVINDSARLPAHEHLAIYQRSYIARLRGCMSQQFSALEFALGEELFRAFADNYIASYPSNNYNLAVLGAHFAEHLKANRPDAGEQEKEDWIDFMIELARFEYAVGLIFEEKAEENYQLARDRDPEAKLRLLPVCHLFQFRFPIRLFYTEFKKGNCPDLPYENESYCVVLRHHFKLAIYDLHEEQYELLTYLKKGNDVPKAKAQFIQRNKLDFFSFEQTWPIWKKRWIDAEFFRI